MANLMLTGILEKMTGKDKDYRYMATSDLLNELSKEDFKADFELKIKLENAILQQLDDSTGLALKCLAVFVKKVNEARVLEMTIKLSDKLLNGSSVEIKCECLDILCDVLHRYGNLMVAYHEQLLGRLLPQLNSCQATVRKKAVSCIASLVSSLSDDLLAKATVEVVGLLKRKGTKLELICTNIQMIGPLSRSTGYHFGPYLGDIVPLLINYCKNASENEGELQEYCLQALESFLLRCPRDISVYCDEVLHLTVEFISYDPNFTDNMEEDNDDENLEDDEDDGSANVSTDDKDASWKVRRAAANCLAGLIVSCPETLASLYVEACPKLINRFKEREENVKMDMFNTFIKLLRQTGNVTRGEMDTDPMSPKRLLKQEVPKIVKSINKQLRQKSIKTKVGAFSVLKELVVVLPDCDCLADQIGSLIPGLVKALLDNSSTSNLKIDALAFTRLVLASHSPSVFHPHIKALFEPVLSAVGVRHYKVISEALRVCEELVRVLRPSFEAYCFDFKPYFRPIYNAIMSLLTNHDQDQDQEVTECAITCMGLVISTFGDKLSSELPACLPLLVDRMGNELTSLAAVKVVSLLAYFFTQVLLCMLSTEGMLLMSLLLLLSYVLENVVVGLTAFLRQANRELLEATFGTLNSMIKAYGDDISSSAYEVIIRELSNLLSDSEFHMTTLALELCGNLMAERKVDLIVTDIDLPRALTIVRSSLLQVQAIMALLASAEPSERSASVANREMFSVARCVADICLAMSDERCSFIVNMIIDTLTADSFTNSRGRSMVKQHLALLCLGEIGRRKDLSSHARLESIIIESFQSPFEEIKSAASYALGNVAVGNLSKYLPFILDQIDHQQNKQFLLLHSLKEVIVRQSVDGVEFQESSVDKILNLLFNHSENEDEGVRNVIAECLGKIALIEPSKLVPALKLRTTSPSAFTRATIVISIKYALVKHPERIDAVLLPEISSFLMLIKDCDRHVRRAAVLALSTAAQNKPNLIKGLLPELVPLLYDLTIIKKELLRTVDVGSFKHVIDDGIELRKAAAECINSLMDSLLVSEQQMELLRTLYPSSVIVPFLKSGLDEVEIALDIKFGFKDAYNLHCLYKALKDLLPMLKNVLLWERYTPEFGFGALVTVDATDVGFFKKTMLSVPKEVSVLSSLEERFVQENKEASSSEEGHSLPVSAREWAASILSRRDKAQAKLINEQSLLLESDFDDTDIDTDTEIDVELLRSFDDLLLSREVKYGVVQIKHHITCYKLLRISHYITSWNFCDVLLRTNSMKA